MRITLLFFIGLLLTASSLNDARKANDAFRSGDFETAAQLYQNAINQNPDDARLHFNLGSALSKMGETERAMEAFENFKQLAENPEERAMADYNTGTMLSEAEMYDEAVKSFRNALKQNPNDDDARHNYEMAIRKQQEQEEQQQDQEQDDEEGDGDDEQEQDQDQQGDDDQEQDQDQDPSQDQGDGDQDEPSDDQTQPDLQNLSQEEAESILNALEQLERELLEGREKEASETTSSNDKDW